jgi:tryptophan synthase alpha chain
MNAITQAVRGAGARGGPAIVAYLTAGHPGKDGFADTLRAVARAADVVEVGMPFSDPMADGATLQRSSREALAGGVTLRWLLAELERARPVDGAPLLIMSYLNPLLAFGLPEFPAAARRAGITGCVVPDLPLEECAGLRDGLRGQGLSLVQFVAPTTPRERAIRLAGESEGFLYAVTINGITGRHAELDEATLESLSSLRAQSPVPLCAGFGIRSAAQVARLAPHVDGVVVGSALVEALERGQEPGEWIRGLRPGQEGGARLLV